MWHILPVLPASIPTSKAKYQIIKSVITLLFECQINKHTPGSLHNKVFFKKKKTIQTNFPTI